MVSMVSGSIHPSFLPSFLHTCVQSTHRRGWRWMAGTRSTTTYVYATPLHSIYASITHSLTQSINQSITHWINYRSHVWLLSCHAGGIVIRPDRCMYVCSSNVSFFIFYLCTKCNAHWLNTIYVMQYSPQMFGWSIWDLFKKKVRWFWESGATVILLLVTARWIPNPEVASSNLVFLIPLGVFQYLYFCILYNVLPLHFFGVSNL